jgi:hypothetical protein
VSANAPLKPSCGSILRENAPLLAMQALGAVLVSVLWWPLALTYLAYGLAAVTLYAVWVCPYCPHYAAATCPAGYPLIWGRRSETREDRNFAGQFRRGTTLLYPAWFAPPLVGLVSLFQAWSWWVLGSLALFCIVGFAVLPAASQRLCADCDNQGCPRRKSRVGDGRV